MHNQTLKGILAKDGVMLRFAICQVALTCGDNRFLKWDANEPLPDDMMNKVNRVMGKSI